MLHRFMEMQMHEEVRVVEQLMMNFLRLLQRLEGEENNEEE